MLRDRYEDLMVEYSGVFLTFSMTCLRLSDLVTHCELKHDNILYKGTFLEYLIPSSKYKCIKRLQLSRGGTTPGFKY